MTLLDIFGQIITQSPGTESFTEQVLVIVLLLLAAFILGYWIGRILLARYRNKSRELEAEIISIKAESMGYEDKKLEIETLNEKINLIESKNSQLRLDAKTNSSQDKTLLLEAQINTKDQTIIKLQSEIDLLKKDRAAFASVPSAAQGIPAKKEEPKKTKKVKSGKKSAGDDLKKIEGVGPKIQELLNEGGIFSFQDMIDAGIEPIQIILDKAGPQYKVHDPGTWTKQAKLAAKGKWDELYQMQTELKGGKKV